MGLNERLALYAKIEAHRKRPLIAYVTSKRDGLDAEMASDALPYLIDQLDTIAGGTTDMDLLIVSLGGDPMVAWRLMSLIRGRVDKVSVLIPQSAYSAATLVALGGNEIVMHPNGHLGPVDMQITLISEGKRRRFSTEDISAFVDFVRDNLGITDQKHLRSLFELTCREVGSVGVGFTSRSQKLAVGLGQRLLGMHMGDDDKGTNKTLVENLSSQFHTHSWPLSRKEAIEIGLPVNKERDPTLEALMWSLWLDMEQELLERTPFDPLAVVLNSPEGAKLLSPAPQLELPANAGQPMNYQASIDEVNKASKLVEPVEFETVEAIMESARLAYRGITKGKILASRQPDLNLHFNVLVLFKGWEKTTI